MTILGYILAIWKLIEPFKGAVALAAALLLALVLAVLAIHLPTATLRVYPTYGLGLVAFFTGFFLPRPSLPSL